MIPAPCEYLQEELAARGWTPEDLMARAPTMTPLLVRAILSGQRPIRRTSARALASAFGVSEQLLLNLQQVYDKAKVTPFPKAGQR